MIELTRIQSPQTHPGDWAGGRTTTPVACGACGARVSNPASRTSWPRRTSATPSRIVAVLRVDQAERCRLGQWVPAEAYLDAFPAVQGRRGTCHRPDLRRVPAPRGAGRAAALEEYLGRFPQYAGAAEAPARAAPGDGCRP